MVEAGVVPHAAAAFTPEWIGDGGRAWVAKHALDPVAAIALVRRAGGVTVFAHPLASRRGPVVDDHVIAAMAEGGLDALEVDHPDHDEAARTRLRALATSYGLLVTGSSDDHGTFTGDRIGCETTDPAMYEALMARATAR
jgi:3',5'-nucleoside bisphosphate phosphatase